MERLTSARCKVSLPLSCLDALCHDLLCEAAQERAEPGAVFQSHIVCQDSADHIRRRQPQSLNGGMVSLVYDAVQVGRDVAVCGGLEQLLIPLLLRLDDRAHHQQVFLGHLQRFHRILQVLALPLHLGLGSLADCNIVESADHCHDFALRVAHGRGIESEQTTRISHA